MSDNTVFCRNTDLKHLQYKYDLYSNHFNDITSNCIETRNMVCAMLTSSSGEDMSFADRIKMISLISDLNKTAVTSLKESAILEEKFYKITSNLDDVINGNGANDEINVEELLLEHSQGALIS